MELSGEERAVWQVIRHYDKRAPISRGYIAAHGYAPSMRDIADGCEISSTSLVDYYLRKLEDAGLIWRDKGISRAIVVREEFEPHTARSC